jgi:hypothetical protein
LVSTREEAVKLVAVDMNRQKISLIYSDPDKDEIVTREFSLDVPELENKLNPHMDQPLLRKHLERHPLKPRGQPQPGGA